MNTDTAEPTAPNQALVVASYPVKKVWLPKFLRLDSIEALRRLRSHKDGEVHFPGIKTATLELSEGMAHQPDEYFAKRNELVIGMGGGKFGRFGESATDAMTALLGIEEDRTLKRISAAVRKTIEDDGSRTELPALIKIMHRVINRHAVANYVMTVMHYVHHGLIHRRVNRSDDGNLLTFFEEMCGGGKPEFTDERAVASLRGRIQKSVERKNNSILELAAVTDYLLCEEGPKEGKKITQNLLRGLYQDEILYWEALDLVKAAKTHKVKFMLDGREGEVKAVLLQSDNPLVPHASHSREAGDIGIIVIRNTLGNLAIYVDQKIPFSLKVLWQMIQALELQEMGWKAREIHWRELEAVEGHEAIQDKWKYISRKKKIMNGFSQGDVPASAIRGADLLYAIQHSLHPYGIAKWLREQGVIARGRSAAHQPAPEAKPTTGADTTVSDPTPEPATAAAGTNDLEEALNNAKPQRSRNKKTSPKEGEQAPVAA